MKKILISCLIFITFMCSYNAAQAKLMPKVSKTALTQMQTYYIESNNVQSVMNAVVEALYNSDYSIEDYNKELGVIRARKMLKASYISKKRVAGWSVVLAAATAYTVFSYGSAAASMYSPSRRIATELKDKTVIIDVNVFVEQIDNNKIKVKFIPVEKVLQNADGFAFNQMAPIKVIRIYRPYAYKEFFAQVENNLR